MLRARPDGGNRTAARVAKTAKDREESMSYAVIRTGGKQYRVSPGDQFRIEKIEGKVGDEVEFGDVLMTGGEGEVVLDSEALSGVTVKAKIVRHGRGPKIHVVKFKRRKGYERHLGHRQDFTEVRISSVP